MLKYAKGGFYVQAKQEMGLCRDMRGHNNHSGAGSADKGLVAAAGGCSCIFGDMVYSLLLIRRQNENIRRQTAQIYFKHDFKTEKTVICRPVHA